MLSLSGYIDRCISGIPYVVNKGMDLLGSGVLGYSCGFIYGFVMRTHPIVAAQATVVGVIAFNLFESMNEAITGGKARDYRRYYALKLVGETIIAVVCIVSFRRLHMIYDLGTFVLEMYTLVRMNRFAKKLS